VKNTATKKTKSEAELIHQATCNLLKAIKRMRIKFEQLSQSKKM